MKKKVIALFLTGVLATSLAACGGASDNEVSTSNPQQEETVNDESMETGEEGSEETSEAEGLQTIEIYYGSNHYEMFKADIHCPDGAYFDENDVVEYEAGEMLSSVNVYDDVREYASYVLDLASLAYYNNQEEAVGYGMLEQLSTRTCLFTDAQLNEFNLLMPNYYYFDHDAFPSTPEA